MSGTAASNARPGIPGSIAESPSNAAAVEQAITSRRSIRAFLPDPVDPELVRRLLTISARAPSGTNMQPWRVHVLTGAALKRLSEKVVAAFGSGDPHRAEYNYYPPAFFEPYLSRRREVGWALYSSLGIGRGDEQRMREQVGRNYLFFDAPVGMIFTIDRRLEIGSWLDYGMFLQNIMVAARAHGLDTCAQAAFAHYHEPIRNELGLAPEEVVVCGLSLGYGDPEAPENRLVTTRVALEDFATFRED